MIVKQWYQLIRKEFSGYNSSIFTKDLLAALPVTAVALPLALAFGVASGADAAAGLVTAIIAGFLIAGFGGAAYQISGPTGAMSAVLIVLATRYGIEAVWIAGALAGIIMIAAAILNLGKIVSLIPGPVVSGFTSGIAIIIALGQIDNAFGLNIPATENLIHQFKFYFDHGFNPNYQALSVSLSTIAVMILWQKSRYNSKLPASLLALIAGTVMTVLLDLKIPAIGNIPRTILLEKRLTFDNFLWDHLPALIMPAISIAALGMIESLLCGAVGGHMAGKK